MSKDVSKLRKVVLDGFLFIILMLSILATALIWEPFERGFFCGDQSLMYPYKDDTVTVLMLRLIGLGLPALVFFVCEWALLRKAEDGEKFLGIKIPVWLRGFYCAAVSFAIGACFVEISVNMSKNIIG
ncbi:putative phosphatidate phosphatase, partial [Trichoplusia ni]|uniref:Phosphatidate phosphatase n=1 Tax=Trichoplusia ni TaxID=7111 RepID=A0A7E5WX53_TRINI